MARTRRWNFGPIGNGYSEIRLTSWKYFSDFVYQEMLDYEKYIWRGQRCDNWKLESTLDRMMSKSKVKDSNKIGFANEHLKRFKFASRGRRGANPSKIESDNDWWSIGQHHGLATPLLDWTTSPFVSAYFAFIGTGEKQTRNRAIFALSRPSVEGLAKEKANEEKSQQKIKLREHESGRDVLSPMRLVMLKASINRPIRPEIEFIRPMSDENQRLVNQGGLFTRSPIGKSLESWVKENYIDEETYILMKILIPNKDRDMCLRMLNRMNINHLTLFPDLFGASKFCNTFTEIKKY